MKVARVCCNPFCAAGVTQVGKLKKCGNCRHASYCSAACQKTVTLFMDKNKAWKHHKIVCVLNKTKGGRLPELFGRQMSSVLVSAMFAVIDQQLYVLESPPSYWKKLQPRCFLKICFHCVTYAHRAASIPQVSTIRTIEDLETQIMNPNTPEGLSVQVQIMAIVYSHLQAQAWDVFQNRYASRLMPQDSYMRVLSSWSHHRVSGFFYVLLSRKDGTILVDYNFKHVYLVLGFLKSIYEIVENAPTRLFAMTLLPWKDYISYDRLLGGGRKPQDPDWKKKATEAYELALNSKTLITKLDTSLSESIDLESPSDDTPLSAGAASLVESLRVYSINTKTFWVIRRLGYSEATNPDHRIAVMSMPSMKILLTQCLLSLTPTFVELLGMVSNAAKAEGTIPSSIAIDHLAQVIRLRVALEPLGTFVRHYAPPSQEEADLMDFHVAM